MATCDICGNQCNAIDLATLNESYQISGVVDICPFCTRWANNKKSELLSDISNKMQQAIADRKGTKIRKRWWQRLIPNGGY